MLVNNTTAVDHCTGVAIRLISEPDPDPMVPCGTAVAMGVAGEYATPLAVAATSNTDPLPYS